MRRASISRAWKTAASFVLAAALFAYFIWRAPLAEVGRTLASVRLSWLLASIALALASYALRGLRWGIILLPVGRAPRRELLGCTAAGFAANTILPARAGELVRPLLLAARTQLPAAATIASILTERLIDLATVLFLFAAGTLLARHHLAAAALAPMHDAAALTAAGLVAVIVLIWALLRRREAAAVKLTALLPARFRERGRRFFDHLLDGLAVLRDPLQLARLAAWSLAVWLAASVQIACLLKAFGLELGLGAGFVILTVGGLGLAVPTPAGVGGFHATTQFALTKLFSVDLVTATAFALLHHAVCFFPITVTGLAYTASIGLRVGRLRAAEEQVPPSPGGPG